MSSASGAGTSGAGTSGAGTSGAGTSGAGASDEKLDKLIELTKTLEKQIHKQNKKIEELQAENKLIIEHTTKMGNHIDFINNAYQKLTTSYLFRNIFS
jgi:hypothetical protein